MYYTFKIYLIKSILFNDEGHPRLKHLISAWYKSLQYDMFETIRKTINDVIILRRLPELHKFLLIIFYLILVS